MPGKDMELTEFSCSAEISTRLYQKLVNGSVKGSGPWKYGYCVAGNPVRTGKAGSTDFWDFQSC